MNLQVALVDYTTIITGLTASGGLGHPVVDAPTLASLNPIWSTKAHTSLINDLGFSQDGRYLVTAGMMMVVVLVVVRVVVVVVVVVPLLPS